VTIKSRDILKEIGEMVKYGILLGNIG
jgi:hypothetical protein